MRFKNQVLVNRFKKFITSIKPSDRVAVIHHTDPDGVCSGVIISKVVEKVRGKKIDLRINQNHAAHRFLPETIQQLKRKKINKVITTDLATDEDPAAIKKVAKFADILIIDHHPVVHKIPLKNVVVIKSLLISNFGIRYCAAKMCYDLGALVTDVSDIDWIAAVGSIGDIATGPWKRWLSSVFKKYKLKLKKELFDTKFGEIAKIISSAETVSPKNVKECYNTLYSAKSCKHVIKSRLSRFKKRIDKELNYYIKNIRKLASVNGIIYYEIKPKYNVKSPLSTILGLKYYNKTVFVVDITKNPVRISARSQKKSVKVNEALIKSIKGIKGAYGGGHEVSSAAIIPKKDYKKFKTRLFNILNKKRR